MSETEFKPVSVEVVNLEETSETFNASEVFTDGSSSTSEAFFNSHVGFLEAVKITGKNKGTISRDSNSGKLPYHLSDIGQKRYKVSDLFTLYGFQKPEEIKFRGVSKPCETDSETLNPAVDLAVLKERLRAQDEMLRMKDEQIRDLQDSRDKLLEQNNRLTLLLPSPQSTTLQQASFQTAIQQPPSEQKSFWKRFFP